MQLAEASLFSVTSPSALLMSDIVTHQLLRNSDCCIHVVASPAELLLTLHHHCMLIWGSIACALAMKIGGEAKAHEISKT